MAKYKIVAEETIEVTDRKGRVTKWDPESFVTDMQVTDEQAKELVAAGKLEVIEAPESWAQ